MLEASCTSGKIANRDALHSWFWLIVGLHAATSSWRYNIISGICFRNRLQRRLPNQRSDLSKPIWIQIQVPSTPLRKSVMSDFPKAQIWHSWRIWSSFPVVRAWSSSRIGSSSGGGPKVRHRASGVLLFSRSPDIERTWASFLLNSLICCMDFERNTNHTRVEGGCYPPHPPSKGRMLLFWDFEGGCRCPI